MLGQQLMTAWLLGWLLGLCPCVLLVSGLPQAGLAVLGRCRRWAGGSSNRATAAAGKNRPALGPGRPGREGMWLGGHVVPVPEWLLQFQISVVPGWLVPRLPCPIVR